MRTLEASALSLVLGAGDFCCAGVTTHARDSCTTEGARRAGSNRRIPHRHTEPACTEPACTEPACTEPAGSEPAGSERAEPAERTA